MLCFHKRNFFFHCVPFFSLLLDFKYGKNVYRKILCFRPRCFVLWLFFFFLIWSILCFTYIFSCKCLCRMFHCTFIRKMQVTLLMTSFVHVFFIFPWWVWCITTGLIYKRILHFPNFFLHVSKLIHTICKMSHEIFLTKLYFVLFS